MVKHSKPIDCLSVFHHFAELAFDIIKAHGHYDVSIRMVKLSDQSIITTLSIMFQNCSDRCSFPDTWKKWNIVSVHKKQKL